MLPGKRHLEWAAPWAAAVTTTALAAAVIVGSGAPIVSASPQPPHQHPGMPRGGQQPTTQQAPMQQPATQQSTMQQPTTQQAPAMQAMPAPTSNTPAAALRSTLNGLLQEHVLLAGMATGAALGGRSTEFQAAAGALDANSVALSKAIGSVYGDAAEQAFLPLWRTHINMFVDYTQAVAANDTAKKAKALADLDAYRTDFDAFLSGANPNLPRGAVAELLKPHVSGIAMAIDAQGANDPTRAYMLLREAAGHMSMIGDPLAEAIVKQFPQRFVADASPRMSLQSMREHHLAPAAAALAAPAAGPQAQSASVDIRQFAFNPTPLRVAAGSTVTWTNRDGAQHSVTAGSPGATSGAFDSGLFGQDATFSQTFSEPGTMAYFCTRHTNMVGQIEVMAS